MWQIGLSVQLKIIQEGCTSVLWEKFHCLISLWLIDEILVSRSTAWTGTTTHYTCWATETPPRKFPVTFGSLQIMSQQSVGDALKVYVVCASTCNKHIYISWARLLQQWCPITVLEICERFRVRQTAWLRSILHTCGNQLDSKSFLPLTDNWLLLVPKNPTCSHKCAKSTKQWTTSKWLCLPFIYSVW